MPTARKDDFFASVRRQAELAFAAISREIDRRQRELKHLANQARSWRLALGIRNATPARPSAKTVSGSAARATGRSSAARSGTRVDWDEVLASVPKRFGVEDVMNHPGARAKGRIQIYPALTRWEAAKKIRRVAQGQYEKVSTGASRAKLPAKATRKPSSRRRQGHSKMIAQGGGASKRSGMKVMANGRVDWDAVLKNLPSKFGAADVLKNPAAAAKGSTQVYPAIGRWVATKKAKKIGQGRYQKV